PCAFELKNSAQNSKCSRPVGIRKDSNGKLVFADIH
ncbi:unnamed protein product, partial [Allacma fusca]